MFLIQWCCYNLLSEHSISVCVLSASLSEGWSHLSNIITPSYVCVCAIVCVKWGGRIGLREKNVLLICGLSGGAVAAAAEEVVSQWCVSSSWCSTNPILYICKCGRFLIKKKKRRRKKSNNIVNSFCCNTVVHFIDPGKPLGQLCFHWDNSRSFPRCVCTGRRRKTCVGAATSRLLFVLQGSWEYMTRGGISCFY